MLPLLRNAVFFLGFAIVPAAAFPQELQLPPEETPQAQQRRLYRDAKPYLNDSVSDLEKTIHDLHGLDPVNGQQDLPALLTKVGGKTLDLLRQMPDVIAREEVVQAGQAGSRRREFNYLILLKKTGGSITMSEYRTDLQDGRGRVSREGSQGPAAEGFALTWMYFHPSRLGESQFRYLGEEKMDGHKTYVVAFAQTPGLVKFPAEVRLESKLFPMLYQGIAWIDQSDFRIVRLRADLLAPQPDARLQKLTTEVEFSEVQISRAVPRLWLPRKAWVDWQSIDSAVPNLLDLAPPPKLIFSHGSEQHSYSNYHLYEVEVKINPPAG
jgi:hypothetical protein